MRHDSQQGHKAFGTLNTDRLEARIYRATPRARRTVSATRAVCRSVLTSRHSEFRNFSQEPSKTLTNNSILHCDIITISQPSCLGKTVASHCQNFSLPFATHLGTCIVSWRSLRQSVPRVAHYYQYK